MYGIRAAVLGLKLVDFRKALFSGFLLELGGPASCEVLVNPHTHCLELFRKPYIPETTKKSVAVCEPQFWKKPQVSKRARVQSQNISSGMQMGI